MAIRSIFDLLFGRMRRLQEDQPDAGTGTDGRPDWAFDFLAEPHERQYSNALFYVGCDDDARLTAIVFKNWKVLTELFSKLDFEFIFYPDLQKRQSENIERLIPALIYQDPFLNGSEVELRQVISASGPQVFYDGIATTYGLGSARKPYFFAKLPHLENSVFPINMEQSIPDQLNKMLRDLEELRYSSLETVGSTLSAYNPRYDEDHDGSYDADFEFDQDAQKISYEVKLQIENLLKTGQDRILLNIFTTLLKQSKLRRPDLHQKIKDISSKAGDSPGLSRLVVDKDYRIWLPDYDNMEIVMTPLPKSLYILFLRHAEGIKFHDLVDHKKELLAIYGKITNCSSTPEIRKRIDELTDMRSNSINEKCSRIKEAFVSRIDESIARNYFITGWKKSERKIMLGREMVEFST